MLYALCESLYRGPVCTLSLVHRAARRFNANAAEGQRCIQRENLPSLQIYPCGFKPLSLSLSVFLSLSLTSSLMGKVKTPVDIITVRTKRLFLINIHTMINTTGCTQTRAFFSLPVSLELRGKLESVSIISDSVDVHIPVK